MEKSLTEDTMPKAMRAGKMNSRKLDLIKILPLICLAFFLIHTIFVACYGFCGKPTNADVLVVYGNKVNEDKTLSKRLKARLDKALEVYGEGLSNTVIVTGGIDPNGNDEAVFMKNYLTGNGIPEENIVMDNTGINTLSSVRFVKKYLEENGLKSVINISQYSHLLRITLAMKKCGIKEAERVSADYFFEARNIYSLIREFFAFYYYLIKY